jgi:hypothetical protein
VNPKLKLSSPVGAASAYAGKWYGGGNHQPPTTNRQPPTANRQPPTANRQPLATHHLDLN